MLVRVSGGIGFRVRGVRVSVKLRDKPEHRPRRAASSRAARSARRAERFRVNGLFRASILAKLDATNTRVVVV